MEAESVIDEKGRISIPANLRKRLNLIPGEKILFRIDEKENLILQKTVSPEEFIEQAKNFRVQLKKVSQKPLEYSKLI